MTHTPRTIGRTTATRRGVRAVIVAALVAAALPTAGLRAAAEPTPSAASGAVWAWGSNDYGQMLDVLVRDRAVPVPVLRGVTDYSVGYFAGAAVVDGEVWAWGQQPFYNGRAAYKPIATPRRVPGLHDITQVAVGDDHFIALDAAGEAWVWGANDEGQLGLGHTQPVDTPVSLDSVAPNLPSLVDVDAGYRYSVAVDTDGHLWEFGRLLVGYSPTGHPPQLVPDANDVRSVSAGWGHVLALTGDGSVLAWGGGGSGELGLGNATGALQARPVPGLADVVSVAAGENISAAATADGTAYVWGNNFLKPLLAGGPDTILSPSAVPGLPSISAVAAGARHVLAVGTDGQTYSWGYGTGALGRPNPAAFGESDPTPTPVTGDLAPVATADANTYSSMVLTRDGTLYSFGDATNGNLGDQYGRTLTPTRLPAAPADTRQLSAGEMHTLALTADGQVFAWGDNSLGQLGSAGGPRQTTSPQPVSIPAQVVRVQAGWRSSFALDDTGDVWAWGSNRMGVLGDGAMVDRPTPARVSLMAPVVDIDAGAVSAIVADATGKVWTWGGNFSGELGTGDEDERLNPFAVDVLDHVIDVAAGEEHAVALDATGTVWASGWNNRGQLGVPIASSRRRPTFEPVAGLPSDIAAVEAGDAQTLALTDSGDVWEWGRVGPNRTGVDVPRQVTGIPAMRQVAASGDVRIGLSTTGEVWVWGDNVEGDLATGDTEPVGAPRHLTGLSDATAVEVSNDYQNVTVFALAGPSYRTTAQAAADGTVSSGAGDVTVPDPVHLAVTTPTAGEVTITEDPTLELPGMSVLGVPFEVTAPAANAADPLQLTFTLHTSAIPDGAALGDIRPVRDGVVVADCTAGAGGSATPDPCVADRSRDQFGTVRLTVRTSHASTWALVHRSGPPPLPPLVSLAGLDDGATVTLNQSVPLTVTCTDRGLAVTTCQAPARADTSTVGQHTVVARAVDATGAETTRTVSYTVRYAFSGFDARVVSPPTVNVGKAGKTYPMGWSLLDANRVPQTSTAGVQSIKSRSVPCGQFDLASGDALDVTTAGASGLRVQTDGSFAYNWKTPATAGCYRLEVNLADGTTPWLAFQLR